MASSALVTRFKTGVGPIAIRADGEFAHDIEAEGIESPFVDDGDGIDDVAGAFAEFLAFLLPPAVDENLFGQRQAHGLEHDGPVNGVEFHDVLADDVDVRRPRRECEVRESMVE